MNIYPVETLAKKRIYIPHPIILGIIIFFIVCIFVAGLMISNSATPTTSDTFISTCENKSLIVKQDTEKEYPTYSYDKWTATPSDSRYNISFIIAVDDGTATSLFHEIYREYYGEIRTIGDPLYHSSSSFMDLGTYKSTFFVAKDETYCRFVQIKNTIMLGTTKDTKYEESLVQTMHELGYYVLLDF